MSLPLPSSTALGTVTATIDGGLGVATSVVITSTTTIQPLTDLQAPFTGTLLSGQATFPSVADTKLPGEGLSYSDVFLIVLACLGGAFILGALIFAYIHKQRTNQGDEALNGSDDFDQVEVAKPLDSTEMTTTTTDDEISSIVRKSLPPTPSNISRVNSTASVTSMSLEPSPLRNSLSAVDEDGIYVMRD